MKKKLIYGLGIAVLILSAVTFIYAQDKNNKLSYETAWEKIEKYRESDLPESAMKEVDKIMAQAKADKNTVQLIKASQAKMVLTLQKEPYKAADCIADFEALIPTAADAAERALLQSMTAELYQLYYQSDAYSINRRSEVIGYVPEKMTEWTRNIFFDKISALLKQSLTEPVELQKTDLVRYADLLDKGKSDATLQPTLFDFLSNRYVSVLNSFDGAEWRLKRLNDSGFLLPLNQFLALDFSAKTEGSADYQMMQTLQGLLQFHLYDADKSALIYADLQRLSLASEMMESYNNTSNRAQHIASLHYLSDTYADCDYSAEAMLEEALIYKADNNTDDASDYLRKAYDLCAQALQRYPNYKNAAALKNLQAEIIQPKLNVSTANYAKPQQMLDVKITATNCAKVELNLYRLNTTAQEYYTYLLNKNSNKALFAKHTLVESRVVSLTPGVDYMAVDTTIQIATGDFGLYEFTLNVPGQKETNTLSRFTVTDMAFISRRTDKTKQSIYVTDRVTGKPQSKATVRMLRKEWQQSRNQLKEVEKQTTDAAGFCAFSLPDSYYHALVFIENGKDAFFYTTTDSYFSRQSKDTAERTQTELFLDRSIYRPGQIVYFKGISFVSNAKREQTIASRLVTVEMFDANNKSVAKQSLTTNEFGSFSGSFTLPEGGLNGNYSIRTDDGSVYFRVEEYKRPTFEVTIEKPKSELRFGSEVRVEGSVVAYAGYKINDAKVSYRVVRRPHFYWHWFMPMGEVEVTNGTTVTDADGKFTVKFMPEKSGQTSLKNVGQYYTYTIMADATDPKGETQQNSVNVSVGDKSLLIVSDIGAKINKSKETVFKVDVQTLNGETVLRTVDYELCRLADPTFYADPNVYQTPQTQATTDAKVLSVERSGSFSSSEKLTLELKKLSSGLYKMRYTTKDDRGNPITNEETFVLYGENDKRPAVKTYVWTLQSSLDCVVGEKAQIRFGTSVKDASVLYEITQGNDIIESRWVKLSDEIATFEVPFLATYGAGVNVRFTFIKDEQLFSQTITLNRKIEARTLTPKLSVFRDKLRPGETAEWTATIPEAANKKREAELLVGMYDASLDAIEPHVWSFNPAYRPSVATTPSWVTNSFRRSSDEAWFSTKSLPTFTPTLSRMNWMNLSFESYRYGRTKMMKPMVSKGVVEESTENVAMMDLAVEDEATLSESKVAYSVAVISDVELGGANASQLSAKPRTNFNETAFFYPQLRTDADGNVNFTFTAPESLTRWNVKMLAHTPDLFVGYAENQVVTQKELMVQLNMPRFVRRSDRLVLSANVTNLTDKACDARVDFELINPETDHAIRLQDSQARKVSLAAKETKAVAWELTEFSGYELVVCKVVASAGAFSDGEQHYLPVLPDRILLTESLPLTVRAGQKRDFSFENLLKNGASAQSQSLTVEFAANPSWYAVQALPTLAKPENDNAFDYFTAYYVNSLATHIAAANPKLSATFDQWKRAGGSREALLSNLEKNTELKNMLLEETPWLVSAQNEGEQKKQIALLFDLNQQKQQNTQYWEKLLTLQRPSGAFAWFNGMSESRYVTQYILLNNARLNKMLNGTAQKTTDENMLKAISYLDNEIARDYEQLKKYNKKYRTEMTISDMQWFYLHVRSEYGDVAIPAFATEAVAYYTAQAKTYWQKATLYGKAATALIAARDNDSRLAASILLSLKENAVKSEDMGMYWAKNRAGYFWNERPIMVQTMLLEAFAALNQNAAELDEMKIWLLRQKQTQRWDSPLSTVDAIYALLNYGSDWLSSDAEVAISLGGKAIDTSAKEAGTGYFKQTIAAADVQPSMGKASVALSGNTGFGWGALYWQYYQDLSRVQQAGNALQVTKKLFVEQLQPGGRTIVPIESAGIKKGDKVITRLVVTTNRDLEFVALKDLRAACFEPLDQTSGYVWREGTGYYRCTKDASTQFFFAFLPKGNYVFEYEVWANNAGEFTSGITTIQCRYAPEFVSHSGGERVRVGE